MTGPPPFSKALVRRIRWGLKLSPYWEFDCPCGYLGSRKSWGEAMSALRDHQKRAHEWWLE